MVNGTPAYRRRVQGGALSGKAYAALLSLNSLILEKTSVGFDLVRFEKSSCCNDTCLSAFKETIPSFRGLSSTSERPLLALSSERLFIFLVVAENPKKRTGSWEVPGDGPGEDSEGHPEIQGGVGVKRCPLGPWGLRMSAGSPLLQARRWFRPRELFGQVGSVPSGALWLLCFTKAARLLGPGPSTRPPGP